MGIRTDRERVGRVKTIHGIGILGCLMVLSSSTACSLDDILQVTIPGQVTEQNLDDPTKAPVLATSVVGDFECAWNAYTMGTSYISDEWLSSTSNSSLLAWGVRRIDGSVLGTCDGTQNFGIFLPLQTARFQAADIFGRIEAFSDNAVANKALLLATVRAYQGFALLALGEAFCSMAIDGGPRLTPVHVWTLAEGTFAEALTLAQQAQSTDVQTLARAGRARARLDLQNFAGAIADAQAVPAGYQKVVSRGAEEQRRWNSTFEFLNSDEPGFHANGSIANNFRNLTVNSVGVHTQGSGTADSRLVAQTTGRVGFDDATVHYFHPKYISRSTPLSLATYKEAQLVIAEAAARSGDLTTARTVINARHMAAGLPLWDVGATATQTDVVRHALDERARELFSEGGWRLNDMLRFRGTPLGIPFRGEAGSIHPNGVSQTGVTYGATTCLPLPNAEEQGNRNLRP